VGLEELFDLGERWGGPGAQKYPSCFFRSIEPVTS
jgi:hypothetical protein